MYRLRGDGARAGYFRTGILGMRRGVTLVILLLAGLLAACQGLPRAPTGTPSPMPSPTPSPSPTPPPTPLPTPVPIKELTICQGEEPNTLFIYGGPSRAARSVLEAIYDGPIDSRAYRFQPVILEKLPGLADGDAVWSIVQVKEGSRVVNSAGQPVELRPGETVLDVNGQAMTYQGGALVTGQMVVTFRLRPGLTWADGYPLTADDSRYAFELAGAFDDPAVRLLFDRTLAYHVLDEHTIVWTGLPGYLDPLYFLNFYAPLPRHVWGSAGLDHLLHAEAAHRKPLGWGAFVVEDWTAGERITLVRNPHYFRAAEGLPRLDRVTFRFTPEFPHALALFAAGECDVIAQDVIEAADDLTPLLEAAGRGEIELLSAASAEWTHLDFGIQPASWVRRPGYFRDVRVRQAIAQCVDRERIAREVFPYGGAVVAHSYIAAEHPVYADGLVTRWNYDPAVGQALLDAAGWRDGDGDGIREAHGVAGAASGTPFSVTLLIGDGNTAHTQTAGILVENLAACGIRVGVRAIPPEEFFADGPDGLVFGRQFELALFSWLNGLDAPCSLYLSGEIPAPENWWAASNNPGYASADYDAACRSALGALPESEPYIRFHHEAQRIFSYDLPVLPLYFAPKLVAVRPGVSGVVLDSSQYLETWNIEEFDVTRTSGG